MFGYEQLYKLFLLVRDQRGRQGRHHILAEVLFVTFVAVLAGANDAEDVVRYVAEHRAWFQRVISLPGGIPAHDTVLRVLAMVDGDEIERILRTWVEAMRAPGVITTKDWQVAVDGKTLRGSLDKSSGLGGVHMVGAYMIEAGLTLGTIKVDDKSNEITAIPDLIRVLNLEGATVTIDAMGCQTAIASEIVDAGADYVLRAKGNQPTLERNIEATFTELLRRRRPGEAKIPVDRYKDVDKGHGRIEQRTCILSRDLSYIENATAWKGLTGVAMVARETENVLSGKVSKEIAYFILSKADATAKDIALKVRNHWGIESMHWTLDVTFGEDAHRIIDRAGAANLARLRRLAQAMISHSAGEGMPMKGVRQFCGWNPDNLFRVMAGEIFSMPKKRRKLDPKRFKKPTKKK